jgi:hypothetical protein
LQHVAGLPWLPQAWEGSYSVRLQLTCIEGVGSLPTSHSLGGGRPVVSKQASQLPADDYHITVTANLVSPAFKSAVTTRPHTPSASSQHDTDVEDGGEQAPAAPAAPAEEPTGVLLCRDIDLSEFQRRAGRSLYELRCQVSLNGQDFSNLKPPSSHRSRQPAAADHTQEGAAEAGPKLPPVTLVYAFNPTSVAPSCISIDRFIAVPAPAPDAAVEEPPQASEPTSLEVLVRGSSFIPSSRLPKGAFLQATLVPLLADAEWEDGFTPQWSDPGVLLPMLATVVCDVRCEQTTALVLHVGESAGAALRSVVAWTNAVAAGGAVTTPPDGAAPDLAEGSVQRLDVLPLRVDFALHVGGLVTPLGSSAEAMKLNLYRQKPLEAVPGCCGLDVAGDQDVTLLVRRAVQHSAGAQFCADGFTLHSADVAVAVHVPVLSAMETSVQYLPPVLLTRGALNFSRVPAVEAPNGNADDEGAAVVPESDRYVLQVQLPPPSHWIEVALAAVASAGSPPPQQALSHVCLSCWLDGNTAPHPDTWARVNLYGNLAAGCVISPPAPKTGFVPGNAVSADLSVRLPPNPNVRAALLEACATAVESDLDSPALRPIVPQQYVVRIRGAAAEGGAEGPSVCVAGILADSAAVPNVSAINFEVPESVKTAEGLVPVQKTPKDKTMYFVDLSMDGGLTFGVAENPLLFLK